MHGEVRGRGQHRQTEGSWPFPPHRRAFGSQGAPARQVRGALLLPQALPSKKGQGWPPGSLSGELSPVPLTREGTDQSRKCLVPKGHC